MRYIAVHPEPPSLKEAAMEVAEANAAAEGGGSDDKDVLPALPAQQDLQTTGKML
jgi:hypothetical protein